MAGKKLVTLITEITAGYSVSDEKVRGVAVAEERGRETSINLSLINLAPLSRGVYRVYYGSATVQTLTLENLGGVKFAATEPADNAAVVITHESADRTICVAYGGFSPSAKTHKEILDSAKNVYNENAVVDPQEKRGGDVGNGNYDDEVVATENYYANEDVDAVKLTLKEDEDVERADGGENENDGAEKGTDEKETQDSYGFGTFVDEEAEKPVAGDYYEKIKPELDKLFSEFPSESDLSETVPDSKWVKINYDGDKYYVVGVITDGKKPLYLCYGVAGRYGEKPDEIKEYCSFIPSSPFSLKGDGYWVMYQDALSGECLKV